LPTASRATDAAANSNLPQALLSAEEQRICLEVAAGRNYRDIGATLDVSGRTVRRRVSALRARLLQGKV
ncbi:MAG: hypothetical protein OXB89_05790, partial [Anaerolineaceae bacterium]|nr:hypothetical protein [Anaerolineaceae bacterium]